MQLDDVTAKQHMRDFPRSSLNKRGYPHRDTHAAKELLEVDVADKMHRKKKPQEIRDTWDAYKEFPADVLTKQVNQEAAKQRVALFWACKRSKKRMKKYLQDISTRAKG